MMKAINPATGQVIREYPEHPDSQVDAMIARAVNAFKPWKRRSFGERSELMRRAGAILRRRAGEFAELMALEMGKPVREGRAEAEKCAWVCEYYAENAERFLSRETVEIEGAASAFVSYQPIGPVLAVMPWNFPFWQVFRFAAPALMAGNVGVLKHASNVPGCALAIEEVFREAGMPEGAFTTVLIGGSRVGALTGDRRIAAVTVTGSTAAGRSVATAAGRAIKKSVLELGGSDPYVVLADADLDLAAGVCATSRLINGGQSCIAAKRFVVVDDVHDAFLERFVARMDEAVMGDPLDEATTLGPQARNELRDELHDQVDRSVGAGARVLLGGSAPDRAGAWYPPTVLAGVGPNMPAYEEELFGPVAAVIRARDEADAIRIANDSTFGLGAAVFTRDTARGAGIAELDLQAGACFVNAFVRSDPRLPFGGVKESGYGRELAQHGIREFVNIKSVYVA